MLIDTEHIIIKTAKCCFFFSFLMPSASKKKKKKSAAMMLYHCNLMSHSMLYCIRVQQMQKTKVIYSSQPCCLTAAARLQLSEWWMQSAYLDCRMPVAVYTSPGVVLPRMHFHDRQGQMRWETRIHSVWVSTLKRLLVWLRKPHWTRKKKKKTKCHLCLQC